MSRCIFAAATVLALLTASPAISKANDIVDFLRAARSPSRQQHRDHRPVVVEPVRHRNHGHSDHGIHPVGRRHTTWSRGSRQYDQVPGSHGRPVVLGGRGRTSVSLQIGAGYPVAPLPYDYEQAPAPLSAVQHHEIGQIVTCPVPLEPHVRVRNAHEIAPHAVPVIVAVRNPHLGRYGSRGCVESLVYVQVFVPPCPLEKLKVSPCRTKIELDYGDYEVEITSCNDHIDVEYDD